MSENRILALDVGESRIGVAVSDTMGLLAHPLTTLKSEGFRKNVGKVIDLARRENITEIVIGLPIRTDGTEGPEARKMRRFAMRLSDADMNLHVDLWDERYTTTEAQDFLLDAQTSRKKRRNRIDQSAAAVILQSYLDSKKRQETLGQK